MIGKTNCGNGGGSSFNGALLHIVAETGSTISLIKNNIVVKVLNANEGRINFNYSNYRDWYYLINLPDQNAWTVEASKGNNFTSKTIYVENNRQYDLNLFYDSFIVKDGILREDFTYINNSSIQHSLTSNYNNEGYMRVYMKENSQTLSNFIFSPAIDFSEDYDTLYVDYTIEDCYYQSPTYISWFGFHSNNSYNRDFICRTEMTTATGAHSRQIKTLDVHELNNNAYFKIIVSVSGNHAAIYRFYNIWLRREIK